MHNLNPLLWEGMRCSVQAGTCMRKHEMSDKLASAKPILELRTKAESQKRVLEHAGFFHHQCISFITILTFTELS